MTVKTKRVKIDDTGYTMVGDCVSSFKATEFRVGIIRAVVVPSGGDAPLIGVTDYMEFDREFHYNGVSADIYMATQKGETYIGIVCDFDGGITGLV